MRLWIRGNGQVLTEGTKLTDDPDDAFGLDLVQLNDAVEAEFGVSLLDGGLFEFGKMARFIEDRFQSGKNTASGKDD